MRQVQVRLVLGQHHCAARQPGQPAPIPVTTRSCAGSLRAVGPDAVAEYAAHLRRPGHLAVSYAYFMIFHRDVEDTIKRPAGAGRGATRARPRSVGDLVLWHGIAVTYRPVIRPPEPRPVRGRRCA